jgi:hypothetical protein
MPQLDLYMYFSQVFWFLLIFICFYILVLINILPNISRVLKLRLKQIKSIDGSVIFEESKDIMVTTSGSLESLFKDSTISMNNGRNSSYSWLVASLKEVTEKTCLEPNKKFLKSFGELKGQHILIKFIFSEVLRGFKSYTWTYKITYKN